MKPSPITIFLLLLLLFTSCQSLQKLSPDEFQNHEINNDNFSILNGTYKNVQDTVFGEIVHYPYRSRNENDKTLSERLFLFSPKGDTSKKSTIQFTFNTHRKCTVTMFNGTQTIHTKKLSGKIKNGYFYVRPKFLIIPFFPVWYEHQFKRVRITKTLDNYLVIDHTEKMWGFALVAGSKEKGRVTSLYKSSANK
jgi:hypothetical protein